MLDLLEVRSYIGGVYENGQWTWTDGSAWDYENWRAGDPENSEVLKYAEFDSTLTGLWHNEDNVIGFDNGYICQREVVGRFIKMIFSCKGVALGSRNANVHLSVTGQAEI